MTILESPGPTLGVVGGGQLGRMLCEAAAPLGVDVIVLDPTPECPASSVARDQIIAQFDDEAAIRDLAERSDVLTFEIELADQGAMDRVRTETGTPVHPDPGTLATIHDKLVQKRTFEGAGIPVPPFREVEGASDVEAAIDEYGAPVMVKARTGGYDGRGNVLVETREDAEAAIDAVAGPAMVEAFVPFEREISVIAVEGDGETASFPVGENVHQEEILRETIVPARSDEAALDRARGVAADVLSALDGRGVFGVELFETGEGEILLNEVAPRPHNSGHWTIEGAVSSQFEQHVRAVLGWPLADTSLRSPTVSTNLLGDVETPGPARLNGLDRVLGEPRAHLHWYGKREVRPLRKMGHVTVTGSGDDSVDELLERARSVRDAIRVA